MAGRNRKVPPIIKEVGFDFSWDNQRVWALDVPVSKMSISELEWHFDIPFLWHDGGIYNLTPRKVIEEKEKYAEEYQRTLCADLSHPIDIMKNKGQWLILDGLHRLMKAALRGMKLVDVRKIPRREVPKIVKTEWG